MGTSIGRLGLSIDTSAGDLENARRASWGQLHRARLEAVRRYALSKVLDLGCATGAYVTYLNQRGHQAFGMDLLRYSEWQQVPGRPFVRAGGTALPFASQSFDTVLAFEVLEHIPQPERALNEIHRVCRQNLILSVPDCAAQADLARAGLVYSHWLDRTHCNFFERDSLRLLLEHSGFQVEQLGNIQPVLADFPVLRSYRIPFQIAFQAARLLARIPGRRQYRMTLLAVARRVPA